ncbi:ABC transporter substrate-binding protein [Phycisphaerales bacterium AB-hyl4]|uniref:ABC transporter substrate-binding protein n=1 Tax=Natronomicrosphaera hydrolytica TaxID=3242702 RepID=A0ABV4U2X3_9BACT
MKHHSPLLLLMFALLLSACGDGGVEHVEIEFDDTQREAQRPADPQTGGELTIAIQADGSTLDPHQAQDAGSRRLTENMYSTLMRLSREYPEIEPDLLAEYEQLDDGRRYRFRLREDAYFGVSGRNVTAEDVAYSLQRLIDLETGTALVGLASMDVVDTYTLEVHFEEPNAALLNYLALPTYAIVDREVVEANDGDLSRADAGSGPFRLVEWRRDDRLVLEADPNYYVDGLPRLARVVYRPIPEEPSRVIALANREVDVVLDVPTQQLARIIDEAHVVIESTPGTFWEYVGINTERGPLASAHVRQAIAHAIDRDAINRAARFGYATPLTAGHLPPDHWAYLDEVMYEQADLEKARALLSETDYADGFDVEMIVNTENQSQLRAAEVVANMLRPLNINVTVRSIERATFFSRLGDGDFEMTVVGWVGLFDPDEWTYPIFHSDGQYNQQGYTNGTLDDLLERGRRTIDRDERASIYRDVQRLIASESPVLFLYLNDQITGYLSDVWDFDVHPTATTISLRETWLDR